MNRLSAQDGISLAGEFLVILGHQLTKDNGFR